MIKQTASEYTLTKMEPNTKGTGKRTSSTDTEKSPGLMVQNMKVNIMTGRSTDKDITSGTMALSMMDNGLITKLRGTAFISGKTAACLQATG